MSWELYKQKSRDKRAHLHYRPIGAAEITVYIGEDEEKEYHEGEVYECTYCRKIYIEPEWKRITARLDDFLRPYIYCPHCGKKTVTFD